MFCLSIFSASQRKADMRFLKVPVAISSACQRETRYSTCFARTPGGTQVPKPAFIKLIGNQAQNAFTVMLRGQRTVAVALAQALEVMVEVSHGRAPFIDTGLLA